MAIHFIFKEYNPVYKYMPLPIQQLPRPIQQFPRPIQQPIQLPPRPIQHKLINKDIIEITITINNQKLKFKTEWLNENESMGTIIFKCTIPNINTNIKSLNLKTTEEYILKIIKYNDKPIEQINNEIEFQLFLKKNLDNFYVDIKAIFSSNDKIIYLLKKYNGDLITYVTQPSYVSQSKFKDLENTINNLITKLINTTINNNLIFFKDFKPQNLLIDNETSIVLNDIDLESINLVENNKTNTNKYAIITYYKILTNFTIPIMNNFPIYLKNSYDLTNIKWNNTITITNNSTRNNIILIFTII